MIRGPYTLADLGSMIAGHYSGEQRIRPSIPQPPSPCPIGYVQGYPGGCFPEHQPLNAPIVLKSGKVTVNGKARRVVEAMREAIAKLAKMGYGGHRLTSSTSNALPETVDEAGVKTIRWPIGEWVSWQAAWSATAAALGPVLGVLPPWPLGIQPGGDVLNPSHYAPTVDQALPAIDSLLDKTRADDEHPWLWVVPVAAIVGGGAWWWRRLQRRAS